MSFLEVVRKMWGDLARTEKNVSRRVINQSINQVELKLIDDQSECKHKSETDKVYTETDS